MVRLLVLLAIGLGAAWGYCRFTTPCYEARCECEVSFGDAAGGGRFEENLNTRLAVWQAELGKELAGVDVERVPRSRLIAVTARDVRAEDVAARANAAAEALVSYTTNANASRATATVEQLRAEVDRLRAKDERLGKKLLLARVANTSEGASVRRIHEESLEKTITDIKEMERRVREAGAWVDFLEVARTRPQDLGAFPASVPEESEVRRTYKAWSAARGRLANLRTKYTEEHPEIDAAKIALVATAKEFADVLTRASAVAEGNLAEEMKLLKGFRRKASLLRADLEAMEIKNTEANGGIERLEQEKKVMHGLYEEALRKENEMRVNTGQSTDQVRVVRAASVPKKPLYPDSVLAYSIGAGAPLAVWIFLGILWPSAPRHRRIRLVR